MKHEDIKALFSRFRDLNLLVLMEDLRRGLVAIGLWHDDYQIGNNKLCPIAHGWKRYCRRNASGDSKRHLAGIPQEAGLKFMEWWDVDDDGYRRERLLSIIQEIHAERLADADAVQGVLEGEAVMV